MKSHNITLFNFLSILCCFGLSLLFFSCSGLGGEKTSGAVSFSFDARSLVSSLEENLQENDIPSESLQEVKIQIALLGGGGGYTPDPQTITFTEEDINSDFQNAKTAEFKDIAVGSSVYARGIIYASIKENDSTFIYPAFYGTSDEITVKADSNNLPIKLTSLVSNIAVYEWEASGVTSDGKREFMLLVFKSDKSGTYILSEIGSAVPSFGTYQAKSYDEKTGLPTEFLLTETVYQPAESNDYVIVQKPEEKIISVTDGKFSFTSASGLEVSFEKIVLNSYDPDDPDDPDLPDISELPAGTYPYEIQFWIKNDGATGTADSDYSHQSLYDCTGSINLDGSSDVDALLNAELMKRVFNLITLGYVSDEEKIALAEKDGTSLFLQDGKIIYRYYMKKESAVSETPTYNGNGSIVIDNTAAKYTLAKNSDESSAKFYLNNGKFTFSLLDENGNDVLADVDWDASSETDGFLNQHLLNISYEITYKGHSVNSLSDDGFNYIQISSNNPLTKGGSYLLSLTVSPSVSKTTYVNESGQTVAFPDFEPVSGTFEVEVEDYLYAEIDFTDIASDDISTALTNALSGLTTGSSTVYFKLCGQTSVYYTNLFSSIKSAIANVSPLFFIDASELTTTYSAKDIQSCAMQYCSKIQGLILPDDMDNIGYYAFADCSNLETVVLGKGLKTMSTAFDSCEKLSSVTFPEGSSFERFGNMSFSSCPVLKTLKLPASIKGIDSTAFSYSAIEDFILEDTSGIWYYTFDSTTYDRWISGALTPPAKADDAEDSCGLVADLQTVQPQSSYSGQSAYTFPEGTSLTQKLAWLAKQTSDTNAEFTKEVYLFCKSE